MRTPIYDRLKDLSSRKYVDFLMPGHKKRTAGINWSSLLPKYDTTETYDTDNLHNPTGVVKESLEEVAKAYGAKASIYVVNGSSGAMHIALASVANPGERILVQRNSHISAYNAAILNRLKTSYLFPKYDDQNNLIGEITPDQLVQSLDENPEVKAVLLLHPSFYGVCSDLKKLIKIAHDRGVFVVVDEAHGAHMSFSDKLPSSAIELGADLVIHSTHKTLPALTQTSILHIGTDRIDHDKVRTMSRLFQTTSPSYIFMTSIETAVAYTASQEGRFRLDMLLDDIRYLEKRMSTVPGIYIGARKIGDTYYDRDITKLIIRVNGFRGTDLIDILHNEYSIDMEYADYYGVMGVASLMNEKRDFELLGDALEDISKMCCGGDEVGISLPKIVPVEITGISDAFYSKHETVDFVKSAGRVSAAYLTPYPPGIPQLLPGELITDEHIELTMKLREKGIPVIGLSGVDGELFEVVKE